MAFLGRVEVDQCAFWRLCGLKNSAEVSIKDSGKARLHVPELLAWALGSRWASVASLYLAWAWMTGKRALASLLLLGCSTDVRAFLLVSPAGFHRKA